MVLVRAPFLSVDSCLLPGREQVSSRSHRTAAPLPTCLSSITISSFPSPSLTESRYDVHGDAYRRTQGHSPLKCKHIIAFLLLPLRAHTGSLSPRRVESWFVNSSPSWMRLSREVPHSLLRAQGLTSHPEFVSLPPLLFIPSSWGVFPMPTLVPPALFDEAGAFSMAAVTSSQLVAGHCG